MDSRSREAGGPITEPIERGYPDLGTNSFFDYGIQEGMPRMLDLFDKHQIKVTSFMTGEAIEKHPDLAREIVRAATSPLHTAALDAAIHVSAREGARLDSEQPRQHR